MFSISGVDIALWNIAGKTAELPVHQLLGGRIHQEIPAYTSLPKYQNPEIAAERTAFAVTQGYDHVKLHETKVPEVAAARQFGGAAMRPDEAARMAKQFRDYDPYWLEEPIFPPETFEALANLSIESGIPIPAGGSACTSWKFKKMFDAGAVSYAQPSVTKVGGISEFRKVVTLAEVANVTVAPHSPYFGPVFLATLHLLAAMPEASLVEQMFLRLEAYIHGDWNHPKGNAFAVPDGPGLGSDPDPDIVKDYTDPNG